MGKENTSQEPHCKKNKWSPKLAITGLLYITCIWESWLKGLIVTNKYDLFEKKKFRQWCSTISWCLENEIRLDRVRILGERTELLNEKLILRQHTKIYDANFYLLIRQDHITQDVLVNLFANPLIKGMIIEYLQYAWVAIGTWDTATSEVKLLEVIRKWGHTDSKHAVIQYKRWR